jgi:hypothetical protein
MRPSAIRIAAACCVLFTILAVAGAPARANALAGEQIPGYDISWPQCGRQYPPGPVAFAIIGINDGRPYTANACFLDQYRWAQRLEPRPAVYVNVDYPKPGRPEAKTGPYGTCTDTDDWCRAYNYGYGIGREVFTRAQRLGVTPGMWWLDVETANYWSDDPTYNAQVIRGTVEFFRERKLPVGIYSNTRQFRIIAGPYAPGGPIWTAGAQGIDEAAARCSDRSFAFGGGTIVMNQYYDFGYDTNFRCPDGQPQTAFSLQDPLGRQGPYGRSGGAGGQVLPFWRPVAMLSN